LRKKRRDGRGGFNSPVPIDLADSVPACKDLLWLLNDSVDNKSDDCCCTRKVNVVWLQPRVHGKTRVASTVALPFAAGSTPSFN
jgi:hypothetical protein